MNDLRSLPSVDQLLGQKAINEMVSQYGRPIVLEAIRQCLNEIRKDALYLKELPPHEKLLDRILSLIEEWLRPTLISVVNATGVILHTNLGRAPLCSTAIEAMKVVAENYVSLEYDLNSGGRGSRLIHAENLLIRITGAEAALVVNNNAAALLLALSTLTRRKRVLISRTQLVEIGGSFRIPDILKQSGTHLVEVGTTNRVHLEDYQVAMNEKPAAILHAHQSNFKIIGFSSEPKLSELSVLAKDHSILLIEDLGSGALVNTERYGLGHEPTVQEALTAGADLVCFSGDKLLGGPQAGILVGKKEILEKLKKHPLARAVRTDKLCLVALTATLQHHLKGDYEQEIPIWKMIAKPLNRIECQAKEWRALLGKGTVVPNQSAIGGGSMPGETLPTYLLSLTVDHPNQFLKQLRALPVPIIARIENNAIVFDPRTILDHQCQTFLSELTQVLT